MYGLIQYPSPYCCLPYAHGVLSVFVHQTISAVGVMRFDIADIAWMETEGLFEGVIQHEMGHVIGIGYVRTPGWLEAC